MYFIYVFHMYIYQIYQLFAEESEVLMLFIIICLRTSPLHELLDDPCIYILRYRTVSYCVNVKQYVFSSTN